MHVLKINDDAGHTQSWWFNFLWALRSDTINNEYDLAAEFEKWGAQLDTGYSETTGGEVCDSILFERESDLTMFVLRWS